MGSTYRLNLGGRQLGLELEQDNVSDGRHFE